MDGTQVQEKLSSEGTPREGWRHEVGELIKMAALFLVLFFGLRTFVLEGYQVQGDSMSPVLQDGERILVLKLPHQMSKWSWFSGVEPLAPGNLVVFDSRDEDDKRYIKRVIACGARPDKGNKVDADSENADTRKAVPVEFSHGKVYVNNSLQAEPYLVEQERKSMERDKAVLKPGEYYVLGDHRSVSKDSRSFGPISDKQVIGRAWLRFWPLSQFGLL